MEYKLIQATKPEALEARVQEAIAEGFTPCGGVSVVVTRRSYMPECLYTQAMTRQFPADMFLFSASIPVAETFSIS